MTATLNPTPEPDGRLYRIRVWSAVFMLLSGFGMSVAGFVVEPLGQIDDTVLMYTAQALVYAGTALGIDVMVDCKLRGMRHGGNNP